VKGRENEEQKNEFAILNWGVEGNPPPSTKNIYIFAVL